MVFMDSTVFIPFLGNNLLVSDGADVIAFRFAFPQQQLSFDESIWYTCTLS
jgi:hypothetical protein